ncbi:MAG: RNA-guided pseudouridylation complex pseudouridine synthase subunit Cbf5 [Desulfurococcales archaeon]|jgi:predicted rRNA pseudouridine synthase|nr:RNA-guided pseudouridylation complex pseudouridine synthase subunit Cbf5 [Desulfurococcales archaeon]
MGSSNGLRFIRSLDEKGGIGSEYLVKYEEEEADYGIYPWERPIKSHIEYGVINLDKPPGPTSHEVTAWVKRLLGVSKAGHAGTLDPGVSGVLPIALEKATRAIGVVTHTYKEYITLMQLHGDVRGEDLFKTISMFVGEIYQRPPLRSSVKRVLRKRRIHEIEVLDVEGRRVLIRVKTDPGTYIRKLCHDIGLILGVGAHMRELRRIATGPFREDDTLVTLHRLSEAIYLFKNGDESMLRRITLPVEYMVSHLPKIIVRNSAVGSITHGAMLALPGIAMVNRSIKKGDLVALLTIKGELVAIGNAEMGGEEMILRERGIAVRVKRVIMPPGIYPEIWRKSH